MGQNTIEKSTVTGSITSYALQSGAGPRNLVVGPDKNIWFTEQGTNTIGYITTGGTVREFSSANGISATSSPIGIIVGHDGNIWFVESGTDKIAKFVL